MTTNTRYNPIFRATRAAWCELTTAEARRWYWQQLQTSAILAQKITLQGVTIAQRWIISAYFFITYCEPWAGCCRAGARA